MGHTPPKDQDKEWAVVDAAGEHIHACWTQFDAYGSKEPGDSTTILCVRDEERGPFSLVAVSVETGTVRTLLAKRLDAIDDEEVARKMFMPEAKAAPTAKKTAAKKKAAKKKVSKK